MNCKKALLLVAFFIIAVFGWSQKRVSKNLVYVDASGVLRYTKSNKEAAFFGVNYTAPFAYGYRSIKATGTDIEKAIDEDAYHFARLGIDAFRVHVWDTEISDSLGNLKENEHLRLFDYLVSKLKERGIKILLTPLAFWGNGYPEKDEKTGSFSSKWNKQQLLVTEEAIKAQEVYLQQFLHHVNKYTGLTYEQDADIIALEINNEPHHSGTKKQASDYINRMVAAVKNTGWTKPVFYNISESPMYADAVANANIDGVSFQWYPTGLVANHQQKGNYLPNVDVYKIPFGDTIPAFKNKARAVYEFDAGDVLDSYIYPAMARGFRMAGFQWATQFAYDPMATAYGNTEYQTHYLNIAYTPSKAISLMIAAKAFHQLQRGKNYGAFPADTLFGNFRVSYQNSLSEMNNEEAFYYSNTTGTGPKAVSKLKHIAGVGSSPVVHYNGTGAYFLDQLEKGIWRLEVMPDAVHIRDPFEKASPKKEVTRIEWNTRNMKLMLPDLGETFEVIGINDGNFAKGFSKCYVFEVQPGVYLLRSGQKGFQNVADNVKVGAIGLKEFVAPKPLNNNVRVRHQLIESVDEETSFSIGATIVGVDSADKISVELRNTQNQWKTVKMNEVSPFDYMAAVPADMVKAGLINYRIIVQKASGKFSVFPGAHEGDPYAWDNYTNESWQTWVVNANAPISLFDALGNRNELTLYNPDWRNNRIEYVSGDKSNQLVQKLTMAKHVNGQGMGWQLYVADAIKNRSKDNFDKLVVTAGTTSSMTVKAIVALITKDAQAFAAEILVDGKTKDFEIPFAQLKPAPYLLLPRPYPGFLPLWFQQATAKPFNIADVEKLEVYFTATKEGQPAELLLEKIELQKGK